MPYKKINRPDLQGKRVYPLWRLDKNICWYNVYVYPMGIIFGVITLEWLRKSKRGMLWRLIFPRFWVPLRYSKDYHQIIYLEESKNAGDKDGRKKHSCEACGCPVKEDCTLCEYCGKRGSTDWNY